MSIQPIDIGAVKFKLVFNNTNNEYWIDPPINWDKMPLELKRGDKYARHIEFGQEQEIEFWKHKPVKLGHRLNELIGCHKLFGDESFVELLIYVDNDLFMRAELDFPNCKTDRENYFKCKLLVNDLRKKINNLEDTKIDVFGNENLSGNYSEPATQNEVTLLPKKIRERAIHVLGTEDGEESEANYVHHQEFQNTNGEVLQIGNAWGYLKTQQNDDAQSYYVPPGTSYTNPGPGLAVPTNYTTGAGILSQIQNYYFKVETDFKLKVNDVRIKHEGDNVYNNMVRIYLLMLIITYDNEDHENIIDAHYEILSDTTGKEVVINTEWQGAIPKYSRIIFEYRVYVSSRFGRHYDTTTIYLGGEFIGETIGIYPATTAKMTRLIHAGKKILENYTENQALITAPRFFENGEFWWYFITSGYFIRGFDDSSFNLSFKQWKEFVQNAFNCDVQINGNNIFIGRQEDFYKNVEVARLPFRPDTDSYDIEFNKDLIINNLNIKYDKFEDDEVDTLDAFHTESEWYIPKRNKGSIEISVPFTADGYSIEYTRREGINAEPTTSKSKDDDVYIVDCFVNRIFVPIVNVYFDRLQNRQNQGFSSVQNIFSPETVYNLRLSLKRLLVDHYAHRIAEIGQKLNNGIPTNSTEYLKNTFFKANGELLTAATSEIITFPNPLKDNATITGNEIKQPLIGPEIYSFVLSIRLKFDQLMKLYNGIMNEFGYITLYTDDTEFKFYPFEMSYNWLEEQLTFKAELKYEI